MQRIEWKARPDGQVSHVTQGWERITGQPVDDALGDGWAAVIHPADLMRLRALWREDVERGTPFAATYRVLTRTGGSVWMESKGLPITRDGTVVEWSGWCAPLFPQGGATLPRCIGGFEPDSFTMKGLFEADVFVVVSGGGAKLMTFEREDADAFADRYNSYGPAVPATVEQGRATIRLQTTDRLQPQSR